MKSLFTSNTYFEIQFLLDLVRTINKYFKLNESISLMAINATAFWVTVNSNAPTYGLILNGLALIISLLTTWYSLRRLPIWQFEAQYKIELIKEVFPKLLSNINQSINDYNAFIEGWSSSLSPFYELETIQKNGKIAYIKTIDSVLHDNLWRINTK